MAHTHQTPPIMDETTPGHEKWLRARDAGLAILVWLAIIFVCFWLVGHITRALLLLALAGLIAYGLTPAVRILGSRMPRWLAISLTYLVALALIGGLGYVVLSTAITQLGALAKDLPVLLQPSTPGHPSPISQALQPLGITEAQINSARDQIITWAEGIAGAIARSALPILTGVATALLDLVLVIVLSIYLAIDGHRFVAWLRTQPPIRQRGRILFFLDVLGTTVGGYIRGQTFLSMLIGVLVGGGMFAFGVPYALLLGVLAFVLEYIPILGTLVSGAICVLVALPTRGNLVALGVLVYFVVVHIIEGDVVGPRIVGRVLGLHPVVAIIALVIGADLFGIWGALFASPVAGVIQSVLVALWREWRDAHPEQFASANANVEQKLLRADERPPQIEQVQLPDDQIGSIPRS